jgi:hypothetical protein
MDRREERVAKNEAGHRELNELIAHTPSDVFVKVTKAE